MYDFQETACGLLHHNVETSCRLAVTLQFVFVGLWGVGAETAYRGHPLGAYLL